MTLEQGIQVAVSAWFVVMGAVAWCTGMGVLRVERLPVWMLLVLSGIFLAAVGARVLVGTVAAVLWGPA